MLAGAGSFFLLFSGCNRPERTPGICLSFDDRSVAAWYALRGLLHDHGAKATFFITQFDSLSVGEIGMLRKLQADGNEIASHGALHVQAEGYIKKKSYRDYLKNEIDASIDVMRSNGFHPTSFAYPYGSKYWFTDFFLLKRFKITRGIASLKRKDLAQVDETYYSFNGNNTIAATEIDSQRGLTEKMIIEAMDRARQREEVLVLCGHEPSDSARREYAFNIQFLKFILDEANRQHLKYYRVSDLVRK
ncbi:MAG TPA: polysaccharide deacetylase family protein [Cyclobacteriaceae bacterium]|nr:polysaccharide deacetylase family protein [Cyclobacteriaceae bacterium]